MPVARPGIPNTTARPATAGSGFIQKMKQQLVQAHNEHKDDDTEFGAFGDIPAGINGGVAQLTECKIGQYAADVQNKELLGQYFFYAHGTILGPKTFTDPDSKMTVRLEGKLTKIGPEPLCETPSAKGKRKTFSDHLGWVYNELRKLGIDTATMDPAQLEAVCEELKKPENAPVFTFRTWKGNATQEFPNPRTNHDWEGVTEYVPPDDGQQVNDQTAAHTNGQAAPSAPARSAVQTPRTITPPQRPAAPPTRTPAAPPRTPAAPPAPAKPTPAKPPAPPARKPAAPAAPPPPPAPAEEFNEFGDLGSLLNQAKADDADAQNKLCEYAHQLGWTKDDTDAAADWDAVYDMATTGPDTSGDGSGDGTGSEGAGWTGDPPQANEVYLYTPKGGKEGEYVIQEVDEANQTVTIKSLENPKAKPVPNVPWDSLSMSPTQ